MSKEPQLYHYGKISNTADPYATVLFERPNWWQETLNGLMGKQIRIIIEEVKINKTPLQLAMYFGVIIRIYCMKEEQFGGWSERDIDHYFRTELTGYIKIVTTENGDAEHGKFNRMIQCVDDIATYSKEQMSAYIDKVLNLLAERHDITIDDPYLFKLNKYVKKD